MRGGIDTLFSWSPGWDFKVFERREPYSWPIFHFCLTDLVTSSTWVRSVKECTGSRNNGELLVDSPSSAYRDGLAYCWEALSVWLWSCLEVVCWLGVQQLFKCCLMTIWACSSRISYLATFLVEIGIAFVAHILFAFFPFAFAKLGNAC